jgi:hypothetical protein
VNTGNRARDRPSLFLFIFTGGFFEVFQLALFTLKWERFEVGTQVGFELVCRWWSGQVEILETILL